MDEYDYLYSHFESSEKVNLSHFTTMKVLGKGTFAKVVLVRRRSTGKFYAMKIVKKKLVEFKCQKENIKSERKILVPPLS